MNYTRAGGRPGSCPREHWMGLAKATCKLATFNMVRDARGLRALWEHT
jgi:hypothetical protein